MVVLHLHKRMVLRLILMHSKLSQHVAVAFVWVFCFQLQSKNMQSESLETLKRPLGVRSLESINQCIVLLSIAEINSQGCNVAP